MLFLIQQIISERAHSPLSLCERNKRPKTPLSQSAEHQGPTQNPELRLKDTIQTVWVHSVKYITI